MKKTIITMMILMTSLFINAQNENIKNGLFADVLIGKSSFNFNNLNSAYSRSMFSMNARVGSKWYFGSNEKYRPGIQMTWLRTGFSTHIDNGNSFTFFNFIPLNVGYTSYLSIDEDLGLELNLNIGLGYSFAKGRTLSGYHLNPEAKLRYRTLSLGLDLSFYDGKEIRDDNYEGYWFSNNSYSLTLGIKL